MSIITSNSRALLRFLLVAFFAALSACTLTPEQRTTKTLKRNVQTIVVIYAENRSFDNLYGLFPGANGIPGVNPTAIGSYAPQVDRNGSVLSSLPQTWGNVTVGGQTPIITQAQSAGLPNKPFDIETAFAISSGQQIITRDAAHRFFENQMQIGDGRNNTFAAYSDAGGLVMSYYDGSKMALWSLARKYVLADNFFMGAFGGSYLNHQYLICACAPEYPDADQSPAKGSIVALDKDTNGSFLPQLSLAAKSPATALDGPPAFVNSGNLAPTNYFGDGKFYSVNTMQPPYQPSAIAPAAADASKLFADRARANTSPPQSQTTIGDQLDKKGVQWKWYAGAWDETLATSTGDHKLPAYAPGVAPNFQFHHQPFNYYAAFDPATHGKQRQAHLKDYKDLLSDARAGKLPAVTFYKPQGNLNQHPGYASVQAGDEHIAAFISELEKSPQWRNMVVVITYDENGGMWDHVAPPKGDLLGPGTRIPAIIVSPFAKHGFVDHTQYDTASILRLIARRFELSKLPGIAARDTALLKNNLPAMGDLTNALDFPTAQ